MARLKKGSKAAKLYMAKLRSMQKKHRKVFKSKRSTVKRGKIMARRRRRTYRRTPYRKRRTSRTVPLLPALATGNYLLQIFTAGGKVSRIESGDFVGYANWALKDAIMYGTGYDIVGKVWRADDFMRGTGLIIISAIASKLLGRLGVNRYIKRIPMIGKYLSL